MIVYFSDRQFNILGHASTKLPNGLTVVEDLKTEDVETGVAVFECIIPYNLENREEVEKCAAVGNFLLRNNGNETEFYTIIDSESDTKNQEVYIYVEDAGLDLLNEIVGAYEADKAYPISHYIGMYAYDSGFTIGINEVANLTRKLSWDGECTATERIASIATQFDGCEVAYSFEIDGLIIKNKYINIYKERGKDIGAQLRLNYDIDRIITKKSIKNLATGLKCTGGTPEGSETPITLSGYKYDDGNFYVSGDRLYSREALKKWSRYAWKNEPNQIEGQEGHIVRPYSYDTTEQATLFAHALTELKKLCEIEVNYEVEINKLPDNVKVGDRVNIIDDAGELYVSTRILKLETSVANQKQTATLGEFLIKGSGISQKVADLAAEFAKLSVSAARAKAIADNAKAIANAAQNTADQALVNANNATTTATEAQQAANNATQSANAAQEAADNAQSAVEEVKNDVTGLETSIANAEAAAAQAQQAAVTAETKATEAQEAATKAVEDAEDAKQAAESAQAETEVAKANAAQAQTTAEQAVSEAEKAATTAAAAKLDAENAQKEIDSLGEKVTTVENTMKADYARKTDLTEATASLQTQITQNATEISSTASRVQSIDETANNAAEQAAQAQATASAAQEEADQATANATAAQTAADEAKAAATSAQSEADKAKAAAETAQSVADKAKEDLEAAQADLATVQGRVDATEEEIAAAQTAVTNAQAAADKAQEDADTAAQKATTAQGIADQAATDASNAQTVANDAYSKATIAQQVANEAKGNAESAIATANEAKENAASAIATANTAKTNAENAQSVANQAKADAEAAQQAADEAEAKVQTAQSDLETAKARLEAVTSKVDATEQEVQEAQQAVETAQQAAEQAQAEAVAAQNTADQAKANATTAQAAADEAKAAADAAQQAAETAQAAADAAQRDVDALAIRVTKAETDISQTSEQIKLMATKEEVTQTLGGYYTKTETDAAITVKANEINSTVEQKIEGIQVGGRNLLLYTNDGKHNWAHAKSDGESTVEAVTTEDGVNAVKITVTTAPTTWCYGQFWMSETLPKLQPSTDYMLSFDLKTNITNREYISIKRGNGLDLISNEAFYDLVGDEAWHHYELPITTTAYESIDYDNPQVLYFWELKRVGYYIFKNLKLEKGNKATDWSPAPEDLATIKDLGDYATKSEVTQTANEIKSTVSATYTTKEELHNLEIGGRNLYEGTRLFDGDKWKKLDRWAEWTESTYKDFAVRTKSTAWDGLAQVIEVKAGEIYTLSAYAKAESELTIASYFTSNSAFSSEESCTVSYIGGYTRVVGTEWYHMIATVKVESDGVMAARFEANADVQHWICGLKLEKGNKATDWTPAPEDVDAKVDNTADAIRAEVTQQIVEVAQTSESYVVKALESYTKTEDFEAYKQEQATEFGVFSDQITGKVTKTEEDLKAINEDLQAKINTITKYFTFDINGLTIGQVDSPYKVIIDNDRYSMTVNGVEVMWIADGKVYTPEIEITKAFRLFDYLIEQDASGNVNCGYVGGES